MHLRRILLLAATAVLVSGDASVATALEPAQATDVSTRRLLRDNSGEERGPTLSNLFKFKIFNPKRVDKVALTPDKVARTLDKDALTLEKLSLLIENDGLERHTIRGKQLGDWFKKFKLLKSGEEVLVHKKIHKWIEILNEFNKKHNTQISVFSFLRKEGYDKERIAQAAMLAMNSEKHADAFLGIKVGKDLRKRWGDAAAAEFEHYQIDLSKKLVDAETRIIKALAIDQSKLVDNMTLNQWFKNLGLGQAGDNILAASKFNDWAKCIDDFNKMYKTDISLLGFLRTQGLSDETLARTAIAAMKNPKTSDMGLVHGKNLQESWAFLPDSMLQPYQIKFNNDLEMWETHSLMADTQKQVNGKTLVEWFTTLGLDKSRTKVFMDRENLYAWTSYMGTFNHQYKKSITLLGFLRAQGFTDEELAQVAIAAMKSDDVQIVRSGIAHGKNLRKSWANIPDSKLQPYQLKFNNQLETSKLRVLVLEDKEKVGRLDKLFKKLGLDTLGTNVFLDKKNLKTWIKRMHEFNEKSKVDITLFKFLKMQDYTDKAIAKAAIAAMRSKKSHAEDVGLEVGKALQASWRKHELKPYQIKFSNELDLWKTRFLVLDDKKKVGEETLDQLFKNLELDKLGTNVLLDKKNLKTWIDHMHEFNEKNKVDITLLKFLRTHDYTDKAIADAAIAAMRSKDSYAIDVGFEVGKALQASWGKYNIETELNKLLKKVAAAKRNA